MANLQRSSRDKKAELRVKHPDRFGKGRVLVLDTVCFVDQEITPSAGGQGGGRGGGESRRSRASASDCGKHKEDRCHICFKPGIVGEIAPKEPTTVKRAKRPGRASSKGVMFAAQDIFIGRHGEPNTKLRPLKVNRADTRRHFKPPTNTLTPPLQRERRLKTMEFMSYGNSSCQLLR